MRTFVLGDINTNKQIFEKQVKAKTEKLVKFFGEEYRESIEKKIEKTLFIVTERKDFRHSQHVLHEIVWKFLHSNSYDFIEYLPLDLEQKYYLYNDEYILKTIDNFLEDENLSVKNNIEFRAVTMAFINKHGEGYGIYGVDAYFADKYFNDPAYIDRLEENVKKIGISTIKEALLNSKTYWSKHFKKRYKEVKDGFYENYFSALKLRFNDDEILCAKELEKQFGERSKGVILDDFGFMFNANIPQVYLKFFSMNKEFMHDCDEYMFAKMFELLTGEKKSFEEYLKDEDLKAKIEKINQNLGKKFAKRKENSKTTDNLPTLRKFFEDEHLDEIDGYFKNLDDYIKYRSNAAAYFYPGKTKNNEINHSIVLSKNYKKAITHEMLHSAFQSQDNNAVSGIANENVYNEALNEVLTEYFACLIDDNFSRNFHSTHFCIYSSAFPLLKNFLKNNLDVLKRCYASNSLEELANLIGKENLDNLCECLTNLLYTSQINDYCAAQIKYEMRKKEKIPAIEDLKNLMNEIEENLSV